MKLFKWLFIVLLTGACTLSAHAQKQLTYLPQAAKGAKAIPYAVNPKLPLAAKVRIATPVVRPQVVSAARPNVTVAVEHQVTQTTVKNLKAPIVGTLPTQFKNLEFLTGLQALQAYRPGWKSELRLAGFLEDELTLVEQTFVETDRLMFEVDEDGNWLRPLVTDWDYFDRYAVLLRRKITLKDHQYKDLFGKFSRFKEVFEQLNYQSFVLINKRAPKASALGEEGVLARHLKYFKDTRYPKLDPQLEQEIYGSLPPQLRVPTPSYGPKSRIPNRTPDEVLAQVEQFIKENERFPSRAADIEAERSLRHAFDKACKRAETLSDGTSRRLLALKEQWVNKINRVVISRTPDEVLAQVEQFIKENDRFPSQYSEDEAERSLRHAFDYASKKAETLNDGTSQRLLALKEQWVNKRAIPRTSSEILAQTEQFIKENGRLPSQRSEDETERSLRVAFDQACKKAETLNDGTSQRLLALKEQWVNKIAAPRTPDEVLAQVEQFIKENGRFPSQTSEDKVERSLRQSFDDVCRRAETLTDAISLRFLEIKKQWVNKIATPRTSDEVLTQTEQFIKENGRLPSKRSEDEAERSLRHAFDYASKKAETLNDGTSQRLLALKKQWVRTRN